MPSMTKTRARAVPKSRISSPAGCPLAELSSTRGAGGRSPGGTARRGRCRGGCPTGPGSTRPTAEESEETALRRQDKRCVAAVERFAIGLQRAIKGEELRILPKRVGVDLDRAAIAIAPHPLGVALGFGQDHGALAFGIGPHILRRLGALAAVLP